MKAYYDESVMGEDDKGLVFKKIFALKASSDERSASLWGVRGD